MTTSAASSATCAPSVSPSIAADCCAWPPFSDGAALELAMVSGSVAAGFTATLTVAVNV